MNNKNPLPPARYCSHSQDRETTMQFVVALSIPLFLLPPFLILSTYLIYSIHVTIFLPSFSSLCSPSFIPVCPAGTYKALASNTEQCKPCPSQSTAEGAGTAVCGCDCNFIRHPQRPDDPCTRMHLFLSLSLSLSLPLSLSLSLLSLSLSLSPPLSLTLSLSLLLSSSNFFLPQCVHLFVPLCPFIVLIYIVPSLSGHVLYI